MKKIINNIFICALCVPFFAVAMSSSFLKSVKSVILDRNAWATEKDVLRRTTPLWNNAVILYNTLLYEIGTSSNKDVAVIGRDGWVFLGDAFDRNFSQALGRRVLSDIEAQEWAAAINGQSAYLRSSSTDFVFIIAPAKWSIYQDKMPIWASRHEPMTSFDRLLTLKPHLPIIDLRDVLKEGRSGGDTYSKLNTHWSDYGAWIAWKEISARLMKLDPQMALSDFEATAIDSIDKGNEFLGMIGIHAENRVTVARLKTAPNAYYIVHDNGVRQQIPWNTATSLFDLPRVTFNPDAKSKKTALVFRDSMGDALSPYLQSSFERVIQVGHSLEAPQKRPDIVQLVDKYRPDVVLFVMTERYLNAPPYAPGYWRLANAFYDPRARRLGHWRENDVSSVLDIDGDKSMLKPVMLSLNEAAISRTHSAILKLDVVSSAEEPRSDFEIKCDNGASRITTTSLKNGKNHLLFELKSPCAGSIRVSRESKSTQVILLAAEIRQL